MRRSGKLCMLSLIASFGAACALLAPAGSAYADTPVSLPITSFYQIVADTAHGHLFISEGSSSVSHILVTNLAGHQVATITGQGGVMGMALSPDGTTLYAALSASHAVSAIDTTTLQQTTTYPVGDANTPQDVAVQSGKIWVSYNGGAGPDAGAIGDIDLSANSPAFQAQPSMGSGFYAAPELAADPANSGALVAAVPGLSPATVASYDVSADPPTVRASSDTFSNCENEKDLAVVPGGAEFILACGAPYAHYRYSTADLSQQGSYASTSYPAAVAIDAHGDVAAGTIDGAPSPNLYVYAPGGDTPLNTYNFARSSAGLAARGLAWSADHSKLFAVLANSLGGNSYTLAVIDDPTLARAPLTLASGRSTVSYNSTIHVTAHLGATYTNRTVSIYAQQFGSARKTLLKAGTVNSLGDLTVSYVAPHSTTFSAVFAGDARYAPGTATRAVHVQAKVTMRLRGNYGTKRVGHITYLLYHRTGHLDLAASVAPNKHGQCVKLQVQAYHQGTWYNATGRCAALSPTSTVAARVPLTHAVLNVPFRIRVDYVRNPRDISNLSADGAWGYFMIES